ncbi:prefoldin subunit protein [Rutstroemia sp. NJR-2017a BVV2]|nr:prefoldin subunit protein [Rutstroemia sp. NJR-2017a BVV2]
MSHAASITIPRTVRAHLPWQAPRRLSTAAVAHESRERSDEEGILEIPDSSETQENASRNSGEGQFPGDKHFTSFPKTRFSSIGSISRRHRKILRPSALNVLGIWLGIRDTASREDYWREMESIVSSTPLPAALLYHLNGQKLPERSLSSLQSRGYTGEDLSLWAWVVEEQDPDRMAERFLTLAPTKRPTFLLLEILRHRLHDVKTIRGLLNHTWTNLLHSSVQQPTSSSDRLSDATDAQEVPPGTSKGDVVDTYFVNMEITTFNLLVSRLLVQARRIHAPAVVSIAYMMAPYMERLLEQQSMDKCMSDRALGLLSKILNLVLHMLSLPSIIDPFKSMRHNWHAQRILLLLASQSKPPLIIDQKGYEAVQAVLIASKKSDDESRLGRLRAREWPPWRVDQDGMDAQRSPDEDMSRAVSAISQMRAAGYNAGVRSVAYRILGGQEPDGTPTIQTRGFLKRRHERVSANTAVSTEVWVARIRATRDVEEAWSAFRRFRKKGGKPNVSIYFAIMEKLDAEDKRIREGERPGMVPGDSKEVFSPSSDNFTSFYKEELKAPSLKSLYDLMISEGIRPTGKCLAFLVKNARTIDDGVRYLRDSTLDKTFVDYLVGGSNAPERPITSHRQSRVINAFINLLCRCAGQYIIKSVPTLPSNEPRLFEDFEGLHSSSVKLSQKLEENNRSPHSLLLPSRVKINALPYALELLGTSRTDFRPSWYALFAALGKAGALIDHELIGHPKNDINAWKVLVAALHDFHNTRLQLDPKGFQLICRCLEKAIIASFEVEADLVVADAVNLVKEEFAKLTFVEGDIGVPGLPQLPLEIHGAHLHSYVRVLGFATDHDGIETVLKWMLRHREFLTEVAMQSSNGINLLRTTIVAMRAFCMGSEYDDRLRALVEGDNDWQWPTDEDVEEYVAKGEPQPEAVS